MKQTVTYNDFRDAFRAYDRLNKFSGDAMQALFDWLEEWEHETGEELQLDVIALCCDFNESTFSEVAQDYDIDISDCDNDDDVRYAVLDYLEENSRVIWSDAEKVLYNVF